MIGPSDTPPRALADLGFTRHLFNNNNLFGISALGGHTSRCTECHSSRCCNRQDRSEAGGDSAGRRREREVTQKDVARLRAAIQTLTSDVVPVVRVLDFVPEDVNAMQKELEMWQSETQLNAAALQTEHRSSYSWVIFDQLVSTCPTVSDWFATVSIKKLSYR